MFAMASLFVWVFEFAADLVGGGGGVKMMFVWVLKFVPTERGG